MTAARRLLTAGSLALLSLLLVAVPSGAQAEGKPTVEWTRPPEGDVYLRTPGPLTGRVTGTEADEISKLEFALEPVDGDGCAASFKDGKDTMDFEPPEALPYDFELPVDVPCNRRYKVTTTITRVGVLGVCLPPDTDCTNTSGPFDFAVAIPPAKVAGLAASPYDPATKVVKLTWNELDSKPADFIRYEVFINPPGGGTDNAKVEPASGTSFEYTVADSDQGPHNFQVRAVRDGPDDTGDDATISGPPSDNVQAGPEAPPGAPPPENPGTGFAGPGPASGGKTRPTVDTGFSKNLPFDPSQTTVAPPTSSSTPASPPEDAAVLAIDDNRDQGSRRATLVPIAGGMALLMGAAHLRLLSKRAEESEIPIRSR